MARARGSARRLLPETAGNKAFRVNRIRAASLFAALSALPNYPAWSARWEIVPTVAVRETYSDNISLAPNSLKQSDWVTQVIPGISLNGTGAGLRFNLNYTPEITYYAQGSNDNQVFNRGSVFGVAELAKELLFVEAGGRVDQYDISPQGPITLSNVNTTGNRATVGSYYASPYLRRTFGSEVQAEVRYTYSVVNTDNDTALPDNTANRVNARLASGPAYRLLAWDLAYAKEIIHYDTQDDTDTEVATANARRLITPTIGLLAKGGYEYYRTGHVLPASEGAFWSAGFDWTPSPRTRLAATAGHRFYGDDYLLDFKHRTRQTTWSAGYSQNVTTTRSQFFIPVTTNTSGYLDTLYSARFPDPAARQKAVENFIARTGLPPSLSSPVNFFTTQLFLAKRWEAATGFLGVRNVVIANVFQENREGLDGDVILPNAPNATKQTGTSLLWNWTITPRDSWNLRGAYSRVETPSTGQIDHLTYIGASITRQIQRRISGTLGYRRQQNDSNISSASYAENAGFASLQVRF